MFSEEMIQKVWQKGQEVPGKDSNVYRKDACDAWMVRNAYGKQSDYGWNIDHIVPVSKGGKSELSNLRPLHWENNTAKSDGRLSCVVTSSGDKNIRK